MTLVGKSPDRGVSEDPAARGLATAGIDLGRRVGGDQKKGENDDGWGADTHGRKDRICPSWWTGS